MSDNNEILVPAGSLDSEHCAYDRLVQLGAQNARLTEVGGIPFVIAHKDLAVSELAKHAKAPIRVEEDVRLTDFDSFIAYLNEFGSAASAVFVSLEHGKFSGIIDYHSGGEAPAFCAHKVQFTATKTKDWLDWLSISDRPLSQTEAAEFIEDHIDSIVTPSGSEMLEIASTITAQKKVDFRSGTKLDNGQIEFVYNEIIDGKAGASGSLHIPQSIFLALTPFESADAFRVECKFRYRIKEGSLSIIFHLARPDLVWRDAIQSVLENVHEKLDTNRIYMGS